MAVKIIIKRKVPDSKAKELAPLLRRLRTLATHQPGYISGETLKRVDHPGENVVISTWKSTDDWRKWVLNTERSEVQNQIDVLLGEQTQYEIYTHG